MPDPISLTDGPEFILPFAAPPAEQAPALLGRLRLPHLERLLNRLQAGPLDEGPDDSFSPPHERALARASGLDAGADGCMPWAAVAAAGRADSRSEPDRAWAWISPCHWQVGTSQVRCGLPTDLDEADSRALLAVVRPFFEEDGLRLDYHAPGQWLASGAAFDGLRTASLDRVAGRDIQTWLPPSPAMRALRRLQSEIQMLLYTHPLSEQRGAAGLAPVNAFWISACGRLPAGWTPPPAGLVEQVTHLREPALQGRWDAWLQAWQALDEGLLAELLRRCEAGGALRLTLCGERHAQSFGPGRCRPWPRLRQLIRPLSAAQVLERL